MATGSTLRLTDRQYEALISARKDVHHSVLSLLPWTKLSTLEQDNSSRIDYEVCRIVAALYSTAVIFPVSPQFPWLHKRLQSLLDIFQDPDIDKWLQESDMLAIWMLFVASFAAYPTQYFASFSDPLKQQLQATGQVSFADVRSVLKRFVWSDNACKLGASMVWSKLDLNA